MRHIVIAEDGALTVETSNPLAPYKEHGWNFVYTREHPCLRGFVSDRGFELAINYGRNPVGSVLLMCLGAGVQPYAGPVTITGWHAVKEVTALGDGGLDYVTHLHDNVIAALTDQPLVWPDLHSDAEHADAWVGAVREIAAFAADSVFPKMRLVPMSGSVL